MSDRTLSSIPFRPRRTGVRHHRRAGGGSPANPQGGRPGGYDQGKQALFGGADDPKRGAGHERQRQPQLVQQHLRPGTGDGGV